MNSKIGRPTDAKKDSVIKFRADERMTRMIEYCSKSMNMTKSEVLRTAIEKYYQEIEGENTK